VLHKYPHDYKVVFVGDASNSVVLPAPFGPPAPGAAAPPPAQCRGML